MEMGHVKARMRSGMIWLAVLCLASAAVWAVQESPAPVDCGSFTCFSFRLSSGGRSPEQRASDAMEVINKYLGGAVGRVTIAPSGKKNSKILLNGEIVAILTPDDAAAEKLKTPRDLALRWSKKLEIAFEATKAQK